MFNAIEHTHSPQSPADRKPGYLGLSFRQLLLAAFLLIAALLSGASIHALFTLDRMSANSRETARQAVQLTESAQRLAERTVAMERSARQYLVLDDPAFRDRFNEAREQARQALGELSDSLPMAPRELFSQWGLSVDEAAGVLEADSRKDKDEQAKLFQDFARLPALNERIALESRREVDRRNNALSAALEQQRQLLTIQVVGAIVLAVLLAFCFGLWLSRPMARLEQAIGRLGDNRFDQPIDVRGPADIRRLGQQLDWLRQRLADLEAEKSRFLRHVSHELKTPLAALCEGAALLDDGVAGQLTDNQREIARILRQNTQSLQTQIEDLLRYNEVSFDAQRIHPVPVDLRALLHKVIDDQRLQWLARQLKVEIEGAARTVVVDPEKMAIVLANLLSNAVRFSPQGGFIRFLLTELPGMVRVECLDQGPGVAPTDAARIFEPFYQGLHQPTGARRGNGIGLSVVREYVQAHSGKVYLVPREGGAHFRIELPDEK
ncbi:two component sensor histidine kinase [Herbaspirillum sp. GW103]|uniref:HAMP domain-containing sensor histidine kinase n=1 Tax=Herbaspirillum sp. GW103 TaxID=1175306 RepID=UPI00025E2B4D|nr:ATP-binding protein [Herbaspirillum sp. GW103]EIJ44672.1 two component sensor histidine kinase [Herbaspirillum sp. GW103]